MFSEDASFEANLVGLFLRRQCCRNVGRLVHSYKVQSSTMQSEELWRSQVFQLWYIVGMNEKILPHNQSTVIVTPILEWIVLPFRPRKLVILSIYVSPKFEIINYRILRLQNTHLLNIQRLQKTPFYELHKTGKMALHSPLRPSIVITRSLDSLSPPWLTIQYSMA